MQSTAILKSNSTSSYIVQVSGCFLNKIIHVQNVKSPNSQHVTLYKSEYCFVFPKLGLGMKQ